VVAREAIQNWHIPLDEIVGFLNNRPFFSHDSTSTMPNFKFDRAARDKKKSEEM
jgi:hypothetical protein